MRIPVNVKPIGPTLIHVRFPRCEEQPKDQVYLYLQNIMDDVPYGTITPVNVWAAVVLQWRSRLDQEDRRILSASMNNLDRKQNKSIGVKEEC